MSEKKKFTESRGKKNKIGGAAYWIIIIFFASICPQIGIHVHVSQVVRADHLSMWATPYHIDITSVTSCERERLCRSPSYKLTGQHSSQRRNHVPWKHDTSQWRDSQQCPAGHDTFECFFFYIISASLYAPLSLSFQMPLCLWCCESTGVSVYWKWTHRYSIYFETVIQSADRLLFAGAVWLHGPDGRVASESRF